MQENIELGELEKKLLKACAKPWIYRFSKNIAAIREKSLQEAKELLEQGANVNAQSEPHKVSSLQFAVRADFPELVTLLLVDNNADGELTNKKGITLIESNINAQSKNTQVNQLLLENGVNCWTTTIKTSLKEFLSLG